MHGFFSSYERVYNVIVDLSHVVDSRIYNVNVIVDDLNHVVDSAASYYY